MRTLPFLPLLLAACGTNAAAPSDDSGDDVDPPIDAAPPPPDARQDLVKFAVIGDAGKANEGQRQVAIAMRDVCAAQGCEFVLMLGDNIYEKGADSVDDPIWDAAFETPYADIDLPFYGVLGNHDYGGSVIVSVPGLGNEWIKGPVEVAYSSVSKKWNMPATHYTLRKGHVGFIMLDTNSLLWDNTDHGDQVAWLPTAQAEVADADWVFVAGHHPYLSNGTHGNAGNYDSPEVLGVVLPNPLPVLNGGNLQTFFENDLCGTGDVYFCGHDHSRQWLNQPDKLCGTEMIVSGASAEVTSLVARGNVMHYEDATKLGFMYVVVDGDTFTGTFYDADGNVDFTRTFTRN